MKKVGDIMSEMGFRKDSSEATQKAFIKYLIRVSTGVDVVTESQQKPSCEQLEFSFLNETSHKPKAG